MNLLDLKEAIIIGIFLSFMIGPVFFMLIHTSIHKGFRAAFFFDLGVVLGDIIFLLIAYFGSRSILLQVKDHPYLYIAGGIVMVLYGTIVFFSKKQSQKVYDKELVIPDESNYLQLFLKGFFLNIINVGVLGFWLGMLLVYSAKFNMDEKKILWFFCVVILSYLVTDIFKILLAKSLRNKMTPSKIYKMKRIMGIILVLFGLVLMLKSIFPKTLQY